MEIIYSPQSFGFFQRIPITPRVSMFTVCLKFLTHVNPRLTRFYAILDRYASLLLITMHMPDTGRGFIVGRCYRRIPSFYEEYANTLFARTRVTNAPTPWHRQVALFGWLQYDRGNALYYYVPRTVCVGLNACETRSRYREVASFDISSWLASNKFQPPSVKELLKFLASRNHEDINIASACRQTTNNRE